MKISLKIFFVTIFLAIDISDGFNPFQNRASVQSQSESFDHDHRYQNSEQYAPTSRSHSNYFLGDKYHFYQSLNLPHHSHHFHQHQQHQVHPEHSQQQPHQPNGQQSTRRHHQNPFKIVYEWRQLDFSYHTLLDRQRAISSGEFVPNNNLPLGVDRWRNRLFVTMPRWKNGVPASLATLPLPAMERSPAMRPYPSWEWHANSNAAQPDCSRLMSVYRIWIDECHRLWVLDAGIVNATIQINPVCPPKIVAFDLRNDQPLFSYELPPDQVKQDSLHSNIIVDIRNGRCEDAHAYITDVWRFGLVVFSLAKGRSWRTTHQYYMPNPDACDYTLNGINFQWFDGVFGLSLSPLSHLNDRLLFFHPMSSFNVRNENKSLFRLFC